jgi:hypothetical protein
VKAPEAAPISADSNLRKVPNGAGAAAPGAVPSGEGCQEGPSPAAAANALSLRTLVWAPYNRTETGWEIYAPQIAAEIFAADATGELAKAWESILGPALLSGAAEAASGSRPKPFQPVRNQRSENALNVRPRRAPWSRR